MRIPAAVIAAACAAPLIGAAAPSVQPVKTVPATPRSACPHSSPYLAGQNGLYSGEPLKPQKLTELPPATGYMAVVRQINGCSAPLTVVEYRGRRR